MNHKLGASLVLLPLIVGGSIRSSLAKDGAASDIQIVGGAVATTTQDGSGGGVLLGFSYFPTIKAKDTAGEEIEFLDRYNLSLYFNTSARKTITNEKNLVGTSLLGPEMDSQGFQVRYLRMLASAGDSGKRKFFLNGVLDTLSVYARAGSSQLSFKENVEEGEEEKDPIDGSVLAYYAGIVLSKDLKAPPKDPSHPTLEEQKPVYSYGITAGISGRNLSGDIVRSDASGTRTTLFGSPRKSFTSSEIGVFLQAKGVLYFARHTNFPGSLKGFSGSQILVGAEAIFPL